MFRCLFFSALAFLLIPTVARAEKRVIKFLSAEYSTATAPYWKEVETAFEAENPDIDLQVEVAYWDGLHAKLTTLIGAGNQPDLAIIGTSWLPEYVKAGVAQVIDDRLTSEMRERILPNILATTEIGGHFYGLPVAVSTRALFWNKDMFAAAGLEPPKTWEELKDAATKLTKRPKQYGFAMPIHTTDQGDTYDYFLFAAGGDWFDKQGNVTLNSPEAVEALQFMCDLYSAKLTNPEPWANTRDETHKLFINSRAAMIETGPFLIQSIEKDRPDLKWGVVPIPKHKASGTLGVTDTLVFYNRDGQDKGAVWKFVQFAYQEKWRDEFRKRETMLPELKSIAAKMENDPKLGPFVKQLPDAKFQPVHEFFMPISRLLVEACQKALNGTMTPKAALDECVAKVNKDVLKK